MKVSLIHALILILFFHVLNTMVLIFTIFTDHKDDYQNEEAAAAMQLSSSLSLESFQHQFIHNTKLYDYLKSKSEIIPQSNDVLSNRPSDADADADAGVVVHYDHEDPLLPIFPMKYFKSSKLVTDDNDKDDDEFQPSGPLAFQEYIHGTSPYRLSSAILAISDELANERKRSVKAAMEHIWRNYSSKTIMGSDEIRPVSNTGKNIDGIARTLVDSLDTLWLMDLKKEFYQGRDYVRDYLTHNVTKSDTSVFETTIRSLGGLLSAYDWSNDEAFLTKAIELGDKLLKVSRSHSGVLYISCDTCIHLVLVVPLF